MFDERPKYGRLQYELSRLETWKPSLRCAVAPLHEKATLLFHDARTWWRTYSSQPRPMIDRDSGRFWYVGRSQRRVMLRRLKRPMRSKSEPKRQEAAKRTAAPWGVSRIGAEQLSTRSGGDWEARRTWSRCRAFLTWQHQELNEDDGRTEWKS